MAPQRIAQGAFTGAPSDNLAAVDVYGQIDNQRRNDFTSAFTAFGQDLLSGLGRQSRQIADIASEVGRGNTDAARRRLQGVLRSSRGELSQLGEDLQKDMLGNVALDSDTLDDVQVAVADTVRTIQTSRGVEDTRSLMRILNDVSGQQELFQVLDLEGQNAIFQSALEEVSNWGAPDLIDDILNQVEDEEQRRTIVRRSAQRINPGDIAAVEALLSHTEATVLIADTPDFPQRVLQQYRLPQGTTPGDYSDRLTQLVEVMDQLQPDWYETTRGETTVKNLAVLRVASGDAKEVLSSDATYRDATLIAEHYREEAPRSLLQDMYPQIALPD